MADDTSYSTFLTRANADPQSGGTQRDTISSTSQTRSQFDPSTTNPSEGIPAQLQNITTTYTSDTDSSFEPVFLSYASHKLPDVQQFRDVLGAKGQGGEMEIEVLSVGEWDRQGSYGDVIGKVEQVGRGEGGDGKVGVYRVGSGGTRVEYYVLTVGERKLVGVVTRAVES